MLCCSSYIPRKVGGLWWKNKRVWYHLHSMKKQSGKKLKVGVIVGSTRQGRFGEQPARWIYGEANKRVGIEAELLDLRDYPLPFFDQSSSPFMGGTDYKNPAVKKWAEKIKEKDAFIICSPEYNHGYPAVLKNALDYAYAEWNNKPVGFVSWGGVGGARVVEQLRLVAIELQMAPIRNAVHIQNFWGLLDKSGKLKTDTLTESADEMLAQLAWWGNALKVARK
ncbi:MAG: NADPH-dependent FMN reductase [Parcubacteria group bacterium Gr01-1014_17]|nr:MAG: NADPH-dependent FMN reductase [Parcubacteria group bacterium Gr01-1014_17]